MAKKYFCEALNNNDILDEYCYELPNIKFMCKELGLIEVEITEAERDIGQDVFYCKHFQFVGETGSSGCGNVCKHYKARNGKNGRCVHSSNCYSPTDKKRIIKIK